MTAILSSPARSTPILLASSGAAAAQNARPVNTPLVIFPATDYGSSQQRYIHNPNAAGSFWVTVIPGVVPAANAEGCFEIAPGGRWADAITTEVRLSGTAANMAITAYER